MIDLTNENDITKLSQLENDVGFVNHLQINGVELAGNKTSEDLGLMSADASNLSSAGQKVFDGQWVPNSITLASNVSYPTATDIEFNLSSYLPNDTYTYEVVASCATRATTGEKQMRIELKTDVFNTTFILGDCISSSSKQGFGSGVVSIPIGSQRKLIVSHLSWVDGTYSIWLRGYRRIGTNQ